MDFYENIFKTIFYPFNQFMMKYVFFLFVFQLIFCDLKAQTITEKLGGVKTNFTLFSDGNPLQVSHQLVIRKGVGEFSYNTDSSYGYGFEALFLEFISAKDIKHITKYRKQQRRAYYQLTISSERNNINTHYELPISSVSSHANELVSENFFFYSFRLKNIPIILLDLTEKIEITYIEETTKSRR
ncbi:MAG: hypothetical protein AAGI07_08150 [Bacteroidota bacterium]